MNKPLGLYGWEEIDDTALHGPAIGHTWAGMLVVTDAVIDAVAAAGCAAGFLATKTLPAGTWLPAVFDTVKLTSGYVLMAKESRA